jgi:hypothetical protein
MVPLTFTVVVDAAVVALDPAAVVAALPAVVVAPLPAAAVVVLDVLFLSDPHAAARRVRATTPPSTDDRRFV